MDRSRMMVALGCYLLLSPAVAGAQQWSWPEHAENLQVLREDLPPERLSVIMRGFTRDLGVRCSHCHVGEEGQPLTAYDFPSDDNPQKETARTMLRMLAVINDSLGTIRRSGTPPVHMGCQTCHRGRPRPTTLDEELRQVYDADGIDAAIARYHELRDRFYGRGALDFGEESLNALGYDLLGDEKTADAIAVFRLNAEQFPASANVWDSLAEGLLAAGDRERAIEYYEKSLELDPDNRNAAEKLREIRGG